MMTFNQWSGISECKSLSKFSLSQVIKQFKTYSGLIYDDFIVVCVNKKI